MRRTATVAVTAVAAFALAAPVPAQASTWPYTTVCSPSTTFYADAGLTTAVRTVPVGTWVSLVAYGTTSDQVTFWGEPTGGAYWVASSCLHIVKH
jgi:hypothetical protein